MKKKSPIVMTILLCVTIPLFIFAVSFIKILDFFSSYRSALFINENIKLPKPISEQTKFLAEYREGEDFVIFKYNEKSINKIINENKFQKVDANNIDKLKNKVKYFYNQLDKKNKFIFDNSVTMSKLTKYGNYYILNERSECKYSILILYKNYLYSFDINEPCVFNKDI